MYQRGENIMEKKGNKILELKINELRTKLETGNSKIKVNGITYYKNFEILSSDEKHMGLSVSDIFIVEREIQNKELRLQYFEMYDDSFELIGRTDSSKKIEYNEEFLKRLEENSPEFFKKLGFLERETYLNNQGEFVVNNNPLEKLNEIERKRNEEKVNEYSENVVKKQNRLGAEEKKENSKLNTIARNEETIEPEAVEEDLGMDKDSITYCVKIKDDRFFETVPEGRDFARSAFLIYSKELETFMIVGIKDGKYRPYKTIEPAKSTMKTSTDLDREGDDVKEDTITGIMRLKGNNEYSFSVDIEMDGYIEFQQLRRDEKTGQYISSDLETQLQYRANKEVENVMRKETNSEITDELQKFELQKNESRITVEDLEEKAVQEKNDDEEFEKVPWDRKPWDRR